MTKPKTFTKTGLNQLWLELLVLCGLISFATVQWTDTSFGLALLTSPILALATLTAIGALVQTLWMLVVGIEKLGSSVGLRKTPLT